MTMLEKVAAAILSAMESEADETMYACGVMSDRVIATIARAAVKAALHEAAAAKDDSGHSLFLFSQRQRLKALADGRKPRPMLESFRRDDLAPIQDNGTRMMVETNECDCATTNLADMERELGRAAFEAWTTSWWGEGVVLTRNSLDLYDKDGVQSAWEGWRGRGWYEQANVKDHVCAKDLEPAK